MGRVCIVRALEAELFMDRVCYWRSLSSHGPILLCADMSRNLRKWCKLQELKRQQRLNFEEGKYHS